MEYFQISTIRKILVEISTESWKSEDIPSVINYGLSTGNLKGGVTISDNQCLYNIFHHVPIIIIGCYADIGFNRYWFNPLIKTLNSNNLCTVFDRLKKHYQFQLTSKTYLCYDSDL